MGEEILEAFERCQQRYPTVRLQVEVFQSRVNEILASETQLPAGEGRGDAFGRMHHEDLFLAIACSRDDRVAWEHFADDFLPLLRNFAAQACRDPAEGEDIAQEITAKLLNDKKKLAGYNGRGSLAAWLRVAVSHAAVDRFRRQSRQTSLEALEENGVPAAITDPGKQEDEETLDSHWGAVVSEIANDCLRSLPARDRLLLRLYYLEGVPLRDIALHYGIHEATAYRWLDRMRKDIRKHVERELRRKHGLRPSEMQSLWKWVSPSSLAESVAGHAQGLETAPRNSGGGSRKKSAMSENSDVIKKEELR